MAPKYDPIVWAGLSTSPRGKQHLWMVSPINNSYVQSKCGQVAAATTLRHSEHYPKCKVCSK